MSNVERTKSRNVDLGFAAVCFAGFLEIFGLGTNQTPATLKAVSIFAISIPVLVGAALLAAMVNQQSATHGIKWGKWVELFFDFVSVFASIAGFTGIYWMFVAVSPGAASGFVTGSLAFLAVGVIWQKIVLGLALFRKRN